MQTRVLQSVGIDIGTTTTELVFSELSLRNVAGATHSPRYSITDRRILYQSPVAFTPLLGPGTIDVQGLNALLKAWYLDAGMSPEQVKSGAVIITGETLKATNARAVVMDMVADLGDFVVATAGAHLESVLAGKGAGVATTSLSKPGLHLNIDIGGGTSNYVVFEHGRVKDSACLNVGGRLVQTDAQGKPAFISEAAQGMVTELLGALPSGRALSREHLPALAARMADMICRVFMGTPDALTHSLLQTAPLRQAYRFQSINLSGGVAACCQEYPEQAQPFRFGDIGPLLAAALLQRLAALQLPVQVVDQAVRATVIGAGAWSLTLSGSTVWSEAPVLPLRNVPVALVHTNWNCLESQLNADIAEAVQRLDLNTQDDVLLAFAAGAPVTYRTVQHLAAGILAFHRAHRPGRTLLVAVGDDMGKALGMELRSLSVEAAGARAVVPLIVIDEVHFEEGDYLDMARPLHEGGFVPLTIKSLAFPIAK